MDKEVLILEALNQVVDDVVTYCDLTALEELFEKIDPELLKGYLSENS